MTYASLQVVDYTSIGRPRGDDMAVLSTPLSTVLTQELDGASSALGVSVNDILMAALGRAIARTIGEGVIGMDAPGPDRMVHPMSLTCAGPDRVDATQTLAHVHHTVVSAYLHRIVHGVAVGSDVRPTAEVMFSHGVDEPARLGHALELHSHRHGDVLALDWWYDSRSFEPYTVEELAEQFPLALIELTSEAAPPLTATAELAMAH